MRTTRLLLLLLTAFTAFAAHALIPTDLEVTSPTFARPAENVTITAKIEPRETPPGSATGHITFYRQLDDGTRERLRHSVVASNVAITHFFDFPPGVHRIVAVYGGDAKYASSEGLTAFAVDAGALRAAPVLTSITPSTIAVGEDVELLLEGRDFHSTINAWVGQTLLDVTAYSSTRARMVVPARLLVEPGELRVSLLNSFQYRSAEKTITVTPPDRAAMTVRLEPAYADAVNITPYGKVAWLAETWDTTTRTLGARAQLSSDADGDGIARLRFGREEREWAPAVVDLETGRFHVTTSAGRVPMWPRLLQAPFAGRPARISAGGTTTGILVVRPRVGAWATTRRSGSPFDDVEVYVDMLQPLDPSMPVAPRTLDDADVLVVTWEVDGATQTSASRIGDLLEDAQYSGLHARGAGDVILRGATSAPVTVELSEPATHVVTVRAVTRDRNAKDGVDFRARTVTIAFGPGETKKTIEIPLLVRQTTDTRHFLVELWAPTGAGLLFEEILVTLQSPMRRRAAGR